MTAQIGGDVLVIEDDAALRQILAEGLRRAGFSVRAAEDGDAGLAAVADLQPDVVITDILMPVREGLETIVAMRSRYPAVRIMAISGGAMDFLLLARRLGADVILPKPLVLADVVRHARRLSRPDMAAA